jgi:hypothetical protein
MTTPALCEVCAAEGYPTALVAINRCTTCKRPFCRSHSPVAIDGLPYGDVCTACKADEAAKAREEAKKKQAAKADERQRITECIKTLGERELVARMKEERFDKKTLFGTRNEWRRVPIEPAWPVGTLRWKRMGAESWEDSAAAIPSGITRSEEIVPMDDATGYRYLAEGWAGEHIGSNETLDRSEYVRYKVLAALERLVADLG